MPALQSLWTAAVLDGVTMSGGLIPGSIIFCVRFLYPIFCFDLFCCCLCDSTGLSRCYGQSRQRLRVRFSIVFLVESSTRTILISCQPLVNHHPASLHRLTLPQPVIHSHSFIESKYSINQSEHYQQNC